MKLRLLGLAGLVGVVRVVVVVVSADPARTSSASPDAADARVALDQAMNERQRVVVPAATPALTRLAASAGVVRLNPAREATARVHGRSVLASLFDGPELRYENASLDQALAEEADNSFVVAAGGADKVQASRVEQTAPGVIRVEGSVRAWSKIGQVQGDRIVWATPSNILRIDATLEKEDAWRVTSFIWSFAPGSEPSSVAGARHE